MSHPRVLSVGQCLFDKRKIANHFEEQFDIQVKTADTFDEALAELRGGPYNLVLVNRVTDEDGSLGVELIRALKQDPALSGTDVMLVSNLPDAQADAVALGALPGFGKSELKAPEVVERLSALLAADDRTAPGSSSN